MRRARSLLVMVAAATIGSVAQADLLKQSLAQQVTNATASCSWATISPTALVVGAGATSNKPVWVAVGEWRTWHLRSNALAASVALTTISHPTPPTIQPPTESTGRVWWA